MYKPHCLLVVLLLSGCALKRYPQAPAVTDKEASTYDCKALQSEIAKAHMTQQQIDKTGEFDALTVIGFVGDFGIGNGIAKAKANSKVSARLKQLEALKAIRCQDSQTG
ncbi:hypothetical protein [Pantoea phytobeneficialis]|uniref:Lipoprotein n=1 Tax=Pantoea phytobeneficialis TaxID=2052056 RepID=A0AAP9H5L7_9GAMM|nr:hypothetical protein [Pantoea phytobeneficialis]MDO6405348.1 hypothetical protein [Pantoea phytobeneficialis]QGR06996.1 hypothetical protein CTZ24_11445 [Pantoea phytobeneficialis]